MGSRREEEDGVWTEWEGGRQMADQISLRFARLDKTPVPGPKRRPGLRTLPLSATVTQCDFPEELFPPRPGSPRRSHASPALREASARSPMTHTRSLPNISQAHPNAAVERVNACSEPVAQTRLQTPRSPSNKRCVIRRSANPRLPVHLPASPSLYFGPICTQRRHPRTWPACMHTR